MYRVCVEEVAGSPRHSAIVETNLSLKFDPESGFEVVPVLTGHYGSVAVLKDAGPAHRDLKHSRKVLLYTDT